MKELIAYLAEAARNRAHQRPDSISEDPIKWIESVPVLQDSKKIADGGFVWSKQREIVEALSKPRARVLVHASQGNGKTWLGSRLAMHFILKNRYEDARVIIVGPSWDQLDGGLLHEFRKQPSMYQPGTLSFSRRVVEMDGRDVIDWRSPAPGQTARNPIQGIHSDKLLVLIEEASNFGFKLWNEATVAITSGGDARVLAFGNPMDTGTPFHQASKPESGWTVIHIGTKHSPNLTGEPVPKWLADKLPTQEWLDETRRTTNDAEFSARGLGLFPDRNEWALIEPAWIQAAMLSAREPRKKAPCIICVDPGSGGDPTVAMERHDDVVRFIDLGDYARSRDREAVASFIGLIAKHRKARAIVYDSLGVGGDFGPPLARSAPGARIVPLNSGDRQVLRKWEAREYYDPRAVMGWKLAQQLEDGILTLPDDPDLSRQIRELRQLFQENGLKRLEKKDEMKKRIGRSPDQLDTLMLSTWLDPAFHDGIVVGRS